MPRRPASPSAASEDGPADLAALRDRLSTLEHRVAALEAGAAVAAPDASPSRATADGTFWLLEALDRLLPAHQGAVAYGGRLVADGGRLQWQVTRLQDDLVSEDWGDLAPRLAALGHPVRLQLLRALAGGPMAVAELTALPGLGTAGQAYHHLRELDAAGWIVAPQRGRWALAPARAVPLLALLAAARS